MSPAASGSTSGHNSNPRFSHKKGRGTPESSSDVPAFTFSVRGTVAFLLAGSALLLAPLGFQKLFHSQPSSHVKHAKLKGPQEIKQMLDDIVAQDTSLFRQLMENTTKIYQNNGQNLSPDLVHAFAVASSRLQLAAAMVHNGSITSAELWNALQSPEASIIPPKSGIYFRKYNTQFHASGNGVDNMSTPENIYFTDPYTCTIRHVAPRIIGDLTVSPKGDGKSVIFYFKGQHIHPDQEEFDMNLSRGEYTFQYQPELYTNPQVQGVQKH